MKLVNEISYKWGVKVAAELGSEMAPTINIIESYRARYIKELIERKLIKATSEVERKAILASTKQITVNVLKADYVRIIKIARQSPELLRAIAVAITASAQHKNVQPYAELLMLLEINPVELTADEIKSFNDMVELKESTVAYKKADHNVLSAVIAFIDAIRERLATFSKSLSDAMLAKLPIVRATICGSVVDA